MKPPPGGWRRSSPVGPTCPRCGTIHGADAVRAVGRFEPTGPRGYVAYPDGPVRATRERAHGDVCRRRMRPAGLRASLLWCGYASLLFYVGPALAILARPELIR